MFDTGWGPYCIYANQKPFLFVPKHTKEWQHPKSTIGHSRAQLISTLSTNLKHPIVLMDLSTPNPPKASCGRCVGTIRPLQQDAHGDHGGRR